MAYHTKYIHEKVLTKIHCTFILSCYVMYHPVMYFVYHIILFYGTLYHLPMAPSSCSLGTLIMFLWHPHHVPIPSSCSMAPSSCSLGTLIIFLRHPHHVLNNIILFYGPLHHVPMAHSLFS